MNDETVKVKNQYKEFIKAYLIERDAEKTLSFFEKDAYKIGTGHNEFAKGILQLGDLTREELRKDSIPYEVEWKEIHTFPLEEHTICVIALFAAFRVVAEGDIFSLDVRNTCIFHKDQQGDYKIFALHSSSPLAIQGEGEYYPVRFSEKTAREIRNKVARQSVQLMNTSIMGGSMGGYLEEGHPLYFINEQILNYLGYTYDEFIDSINGLIMNCIHPDDRDYVEEVLKQSFEKGDTYEVQYRMRKKDGNYIWILDRGKRIDTGNGRMGIISLCLDITDMIQLQKKQEKTAEVLRIKNKKLEEITSNVPSGFVKCTLDEHCEILFLTDALCNLVGYSKKEIKGYFNNQFYDLIYEEDRSFVRTIVLQKRVQEKNNGEQCLLEYRIRKKDGKVIWVSDNMKVLVENGEKFCYSVITDITEAKEKDQNLKLLTSSIPGGVFTVRMDEDFTLLYGNEGFYELHGYTAFQMKVELGNKLIAIIHPEDIPIMTDVVFKAFHEGEKGFEFEVRTLTLNGDIIWELVKGNFIRKEEEFVLNCVAIDITVRKKMEQELKMNEERFRIALEQTKNEVFDYDIETKTVKHSKRFSEMFGLPIEMQNVPQSLVEQGVVHQEDEEDFKTMFQQIDLGEKVACCKVKLRDVEGHFLWNKIVLTSIFDEKGKQVRAVGITEDITLQHEVEMAYMKEEQYRFAMLSGAVADIEINITKDKLECGRGSWFQEKNVEQCCSFEWFLNHKMKQQIYPEDREKFFHALNREQLIFSYENGIREIQCEHRQFKNNQGDIIWMVIIVHLLKDPISGDLKGIGYLKNIDKRKKEELWLQYQSKRDSLTGLYNKKTVEKHIKEFLKDAEKSQEHAFFIIDLDDFKNINDSYGHMFGDWVLLEIANRLKEVFETYDIIGRIGGDEFIIFAKNREKEEIEELASKVCKILADTQGNTTPISCSVGISWFCKDGITFEELYQKADMALYEAKNSGRNQFVIYHGPQKEWKWTSFPNISEDSGLSMFPNIQLAEGKDITSTEKKWLQLEQQTVLDMLEGIVYVIDIEDYRILYINDVGAKILNLDKKSCIGKKCYEVLQGLDSPCSFCNNSLLRTGEYYRWEYENTKIGKRFYLRDKLIPWNNRWARMEIALDVSLKEKFEQNLWEQANKGSVLLQCILLMMETKDYKKIAQGIAETIGKHYKADRVYIMSFDSRTMLCKDVNTWCANGIESFEESWKNTFLNEIIFFGKEYHKNNIISITNIERLKWTAPKVYTRLKEYGVHSFLIMPLQLDDTVKAFITIDNPEKLHQDSEILETLVYLFRNEFQKYYFNQKLEYMKYYDELTGLPNRKSFIKYLDGLNVHTLQSMGVTMADINGLKEVNRRYGESRGDDLILKTVEILKNSFQNQDFFRLDGDEFVIFSPNMNNQDFSNKIQSVKKTFQTLNGVSVSIGHVWEDMDIDMEHLMSQASELMLLSKQQYYEKSQLTSKYYRPKVLQELIYSIRHNHFKVYLQPKVNIMTEEVIGVEALVRYIRPGYGVISPEKFIPMLEENKIIRFIDFFVLEKVCQYIIQWKNLNKKMIPISLNFSRLTLLEEDFLETLQTILHKYEVPSEYIELEVTETIGEMERETIKQMSKKLKENGFKIALDDFGTKYTNISILTTMDFDVLKLDRSLVNNLAKSKKNQIIVESMVEMCKRMNIQIIAEGVETENQLEMLKSLGCIFVQGYYYSKPIPKEEFDQKYLS